MFATARGEAIPHVGTTRFRPPYTPVAIGAFAGHERGKEFQPLRRTAMHDCGENLVQFLSRRVNGCDRNTIPSPAKA